MLDYIWPALLNLLSPANIAIIIVSGFIGTLAGAMPGISASAITAIFIPFTVWLPTDIAIVALIALYASATYGGSITAILYRIPGTPTSVMTTIDGYEMTKKGRSGEALMLSRFYSLLGGLIGGLFIIFMTPLFVDIAIMFRSQEIFALILMALAFLATFEGGVKALLSAFFGFFLATIGQDPLTGIFRFTFDIPLMGGGLGIVPVFLGLFAVSEILRLMEGELHPFVASEKYRFRELLTPSWNFFKKSAPLIFVIAIPIGFLIGVLPGVGATTAAVVSYTMAKGMSKKPEEWGKGIPEGVAVPEAANNAAAMGTLVLTLTLGIPGGATAALILGALIMHGATPGRYIFKDNPLLGYTILLGAIISNIVFYVTAPIVIHMFVKLGEFLRRNIPQMAVLIVFFSIIGTYVIRNSVFDSATVLVLGIIGYLMSKCKIPLGPAAITFVLGPLAEKYFRRALDISRGDFTTFVSSPVSISIYVLTLALIVLPRIYLKMKQAKDPEKTN
ncbi:MAG: tripartite tricarboxylate transporter permease [Sulfolobales archaeon]